MTEAHPLKGSGSIDLRLRSSAAPACPLIQTQGSAATPLYDSGCFALTAGMDRVTRNTVRSLYEGESMFKRLGIALAAVVLTGCAITQEVTPVRLGQAAQELCVVRNSEVVQDGFHDVYVQVLERKGFRVRTLADKAPVDSCPLLATYEAIYRWDMAIYLARADLPL